MAEPNVAMELATKLAQCRLEREEAVSQLQYELKKTRARGIEFQAGLRAQVEALQQENNRFGQENLDLKRVLKGARRAKLDGVGPGQGAFRDHASAGSPTSEDGATSHTSSHGHHHAHEPQADSSEDDPAMSVDAVDSPGTPPGGATRPHEHQRPTSTAFPATPNHHPLQAGTPLHLMRTPVQLSKQEREAIVEQEVAVAVARARRERDGTWLGAEGRGVLGEASNE